MSDQQAKYQVRLSLGEPGAVDADVIWYADAFTTRVGEPNGSDVWPGSPVGLSGVRAAADWVLCEQVRRGERVSVLVVVRGSEVPGELPVAHLAVAGALVNALGSLGIDHTSPEAAAVEALWLGVAPVRRHLIGNSSALLARRAAGMSEANLAALLALGEEHSSF